jgi:hypothetical protein
LPVFCLPEFFLEICQGWTQETLKQLVLTMTKKGSIPLPLFYENVTDMRSISNKRQALAELYQWLNYKGVDRIDTL